MYQELDMVVLARDIQEKGLKKGDVGVIVHIYEQDAVEVEFVDADGNTVAVLTLKSADIRSMKHREILHVRDLDSATHA